LIRSTLLDALMRRRSTARIIDMEMSPANWQLGI